jgi:hypothetical protein
MVNINNDTMIQYSESVRDYLFDRRNGGYKDKAMMRSIQSIIKQDEAAWMKLHHNFQEGYEVYEGPHAMRIVIRCLANTIQLIEIGDHTDVYSIYGTGRPEPREAKIVFSVRVRDLLRSNSIYSGQNKICQLIDTYDSLSTWFKNITKMVALGMAA